MLESDKVFDISLYSHCDSWLACSVDESYRQCCKVYRYWFSPSALLRWRHSQRVIWRSQSQVRDSVCYISLSSSFFFWSQLSDTGIGLSATEIDLLFVPFQQADVGKSILHLANKLLNKIIELFNASLRRHRSGIIHISTACQTYARRNWSDIEAGAWFHVLVYDSCNNL